MNFRCKFCNNIFESNYKKARFCKDICKKLFFDSYDNSHSLYQKKKNLKRKIPYCQICNNSKKAVLEVHHIIPLEHGGSNDYENLQVLCSSCHSEQHFGAIENLEIKLVDYTLIREQKLSKLETRLKQLEEDS